MFTCNMIRFFVPFQLLALASSFSVLPTSRQQMLQAATRTRLASSVENEEKAVQCFIVNEFEVVEEGAAPEIVCTPEPDDYAWFNGLEVEAMKPVGDEISEDFLECVEGASPRGVPEWECKKKDNATVQ